MGSPIEIDYVEIVNVNYLLFISWDDKEIKQGGK
jgi:hypothetical protein